MPRWVLGLLVLLAATEAGARPPPPYEIAETEVTERPTLIEWTTWLRGGIVVDRSEPAPTSAARTTTMPVSTVERDRTLGGAIGAGFTLPVGSKVRVGPWVELRSWGLPLVGGEITALPGSLDMFFYKGSSAITLRAGANPDVRSAQLGLAYRAPWDLFGTRPRASRYMIGVGVVATVTQSRTDPNDWSALVGLELEPLGAIRYLLGIRSWY